jgi:glycosyltransferase involved in cell wall biosynthesis
MLTISIVTPVRNGAKALRGCIESVRNQNHPSEHIIVDGASTDGTLKIIDEYRSSISRTVSEPDKGVYDAMNKGIKLASGEIIGILNADDMYADENVISRVAAAFERKGIESCYGDLTYVDSLDITRVVRLWRSGAFGERKLFAGWMPPHPTFFLKRNVYEKYGMFNLDLGSAADYELMLRLLLKYKISTFYIPLTLVKMRVGGVSNASIRNRIRANLMDRRAWEVNGLKPYPWTLWMKPLRKLGQYSAKH